MQSDTLLTSKSERSESEASEQLDEVKTKYPSKRSKERLDKGNGVKSKFIMLMQTNCLIKLMTCAVCIFVGFFLTILLLRFGYRKIPGLSFVCESAWDSEARCSSPIDFEVFGPAMEPAHQCADSCTFTLVESIPQNLVYNSSYKVHMSTYTALTTLMASATTSIQIASYYWTLLGTDTSYHDNTSVLGEDIFQSLLAISKANKVPLQIVQNAENNDTDSLAEQGHAQVRTLNFSRLLGSGILHTKFWLVDGQHFYIGSANLDWRSLTQVKEMGVLVQNCPCLGNDLKKIFNVYWYLGQSDVTVPNKWPSQFNTSINETNPLSVSFNNTRAPVFISSSPPPFCPGGRTADLDAILHVISQAKQFVNIAVMDYEPATLYTNDNLTSGKEIWGPSYWPVIDDALRKAAYTNHVTVRLLASKWQHTQKNMFSFLCSLKMMGYLRSPNTILEVKLFNVTSSQEQSKIPFARVNHNKYMVTDQHAYIGTSNWSGDYFINTAGVGFVVQQASLSGKNTTNDNFSGQLYEVFMRDWMSKYASEVNCSHYHKP